jgi:tetratricopeptide (TPR) repeat protein
MDKKNISKLYTKAINSKQKGDYNSCIEYYTKIVELKPNNVTYLQENGEVYELMGNYNKAIELYNRILLLQPNNGVILNQVGCCYNKLSQFKKSIEYFRKVLVIKNDIPEVYRNIGNCYTQLKEYRNAEINLLIAQRLRPNDDDSKSSVAEIYFYTKMYDKSISYYENISNLSSNSKQLYNLSFPYLAKKKFIHGFTLYENRLDSNGICRQTGEKLRVEIPWFPYWNGITACNRLLVIYEQGIGDNIQYFRFIIELSKKYPEMKITYFCKNIISHLFDKDKYDNIKIVTDLINDNIFDYKLYIMSLPHILQIDAIPYNTEKYITVNADKYIYWNNKLSELKRMKIGFIYNGLLSSFIEKYIPLEEFKSICDLNVDLICLHKKKDIQSDIDKISFTDKLVIHDIDIDLPFEDTVAILKNIDLLITIDTSITHLAGVLGVKTWLLLGFGSDWRWFNDPKDSVWYQSVELMRITENIELNNILKTVKNRLITEYNV